MADQQSIQSQLAYTTIRIECRKSEGVVSVGTGFFFEFDAGDSTDVRVLVTNKHVIKNSKSALLHWTLADESGNPIEGSPFTTNVSNFSAGWIDHPDENVDLTILPIWPIVREIQEKKNASVYFRTFSKKLIPDPEEMSNLAALEDVVMIGYPAGIWDAFNNMPIFRRGSTATHPRHDYQGRKEFLIDIACFAGSSGSPVVHYPPPMRRDSRSRNWTIGPRKTQLLGILYSGYQLGRKGDVQLVPIPTQQKPALVTKVPINLGCVIKAQRLLEFEEPIRRRLQGQPQGGAENRSQQ